MTAFKNPSRQALLIKIKSKIMIKTFQGAQRTLRFTADPEHATTASPCAWLFSESRKPR
jgi:hypothetical protein